MSEETVRLRVEGMSCQHCVQTVERALLQTPGVTAATVDLGGAEAVVRYDPGQVEADELLALVEEIGYGAALA